MAAAAVAAVRFPSLSYPSSRRFSPRGRPFGCQRWNIDAAESRRSGAVAAESRRALPPKAAAASGVREAGSSDPELHLVLELATDAELMELEEILFGTSYFSPLLKSMGKRPDSDYILDVDDVKGREILISHLESRFFYLAADARSVIRGSRPSYRNVLLGLRRRLSIPCSSKLATEDLEVEIFLHLLNEYSSGQTEPTTFSWKETRSLKDHTNLEVGLNKWKVLVDAALKGGTKGLKHVLLKGSGLLTLEKIYELLAKRLSGKLLREAANYEIKNELIKRGGQLAAINLEKRAGLLAARQGMAHAASRYLGLRSLMTFIGPIMWGTFLADVVIQMLGTDYARILRAVYAFAQIRLTRACGVASFEN